MIFESMQILKSKANIRLSSSIFFYYLQYRQLPFLLCFSYRLNSTGGQGKCDSKLEIAILYFFKSFKRIYMMDTVNGGTSIGMGLVPGGNEITLIYIVKHIAYVMIDRISFVHSCAYFLLFLQLNALYLTISFIIFFSLIFITF